MDNSAGSDVQLALGLLQAELTRLRESSGDAWRSYLQWFTWFFTAQIVLFGWVLTKKPGEVLKPLDVSVMAAVLTTLNMLAVLAALRQRAFRRLQSRRSDTICRSMSNYAEQAGLQIEITSGFSDDLVQSAFGAFIVALLATVVMWLYVVYR